MRLHRTSQILWLLPILLAGCSSTAGSRFGGTERSRSIAVVGDQPLPTPTGEPGSRVAADDQEPEPRRNPKTRISGRVVDEAGDPVAGATVRLADGGAKGGKEIRGTTDRSGGFTLNGLRPNSIYELIAEGEDEHGPIIGRAEARTGKTGVEISLAPEAKATTTRQPARPSRIKPVSNREDVEAGPEPDHDGPPKVNREDVAPPADDLDSIDPGPPRASNAGRPQLAPPDPGIGWKNSNNATASRSKDEDVEGDSTSPASPPKQRRSPKKQGSADADANPLPPALERDGNDEPDLDRPASARSNKPRKVGAKPAPRSRESGEIALAPDEVSLDEKADRSKGVAEAATATSSLAGEFRSMSSLMPDFEPAVSTETRPIDVATTQEAAPKEPDGPPALPPVGGESVVVAAHEGPNPTAPPPDPATAPHEITPSKPASQPVFASQGPSPAADEKPGPAADYNPFATLPPPAPPNDTVAANPPVDRPAPAEEKPTGVEEVPRKKWGELASTEPRPVVVQPTKVTLTGSLFRRMRGPAEGKDKDTAIAACSYDPKLRKINDLRLPDLEGRPVRFQDFDADFVLLDFWGTWCEPCLDAIPHLVDLQKKYGPGKLKVVGIACEEIPPAKRKAKVEEVSRKFGINYPVLLSTMDGKPCPVQQALQVQAMPTMILVDRRGQVLWRNAGSTTESEGRLDRILALSLSRGNTARR